MKHSTSHCVLQPYPSPGRLYYRCSCGTFDWLSAPKASPLPSAALPGSAEYVVDELSRRQLQQPGTLGDQPVMEIMEVSIVMGVPPIAGWFLRENPIETDDDWGSFSKSGTPIQVMDDNDLVLKPMGTWGFPILRNQAIFFGR